MFYAAVGNMIAVIFSFACDFALGNPTTPKVAADLADC